MESTTLKCGDCPLRAKYDRKPKSLAGRFWRWHINFCLGWKAYFTSLAPEEKAQLRVESTIPKRREKHRFCLTIFYTFATNFF